MKAAVEYQKLQFLDFEETAEWVVLTEARGKKEEEPPEPGEEGLRGSRAHLELPLQDAWTGHEMRSVALFQKC